MDKVEKTLYTLYNSSYRIKMIIGRSAIVDEKELLAELEKHKEHVNNAIEELSK